MNNSGSRSRSASSACAFARAARALAALPAISPTVGFNWASVIENRSARSVMGGSCLVAAQTAIAWLDRAHLDRAHAFGDRKQPKQARGDERHADRGRTHVLDPPDLRIVVGGEAVGEFFDRRVE